MYNSNENNNNNSNNNRNGNYGNWYYENESPNRSLYRERSEEESRYEQYRLLYGANEVERDKVEKNENSQLWTDDEINGENTAYEENVLNSYAPELKVNVENPMVPYKTEKKSGNKFLKAASIAICGAILGSVISTAATYGLMNVNYGGDGQSSNGVSSQPSSQQSQSSGSVTLPVVNNEENNSGINSSFVTDIAEKTKNSVVGIRAVYSVATGFYGGSQEQAGEGSGLIYTNDGYIITNYHVIEDAVSYKGTIEVYLETTDTEPYIASVIGYDNTADLAVIKIDKTGLTPLEVADSDALVVGQWAIAVGNPGGLEYMGSVSFGIVSGLDRKVQLESVGTMNLIQTDAAINPGNSGGPLLDVNGRLIGVNSAKLAGNTSISFEGMGFAIPSNDVVEICNRLIERQGQKIPYIGITASTRYTGDYLVELGYPEGVLISAVAEGSPAKAAGLMQSDVIVAINGIEVKSFEALVSEKNKYSVGDVISLNIYRDGIYKDIQLTLGATE